MDLFKTENLLVNYRIIISNYFIIHISSIKPLLFNVKVRFKFRAEKVPFFRSMHDGLLGSNANTSSPASTYYILLSCRHRLYICMGGCSFILLIKRIKTELRKFLVPSLASRMLVKTRVHSNESSYKL
jgi:hypothetical protein